MPATTARRGADTLGELEHEIVTLAAHIAAADHRLLVKVADFDRRQGWRLGGYRSCAHWLSCVTAVSERTARARVRVARALDAGHYGVQEGVGCVPALGAPADHPLRGVTRRGPGSRLPRSRLSSPGCRLGPPVQAAGSAYEDTPPALDARRLEPGGGSPHGWLRRLTRGPGPLPGNGFLFRSRLPCHVGACVRAAPAGRSSSPLESRPRRVRDREPGGQVSCARTIPGSARDRGPGRPPHFRVARRCRGLRTRRPRRGRASHAPAPGGVAAPASSAVSGRAPPHSPARKTK